MQHHGHSVAQRVERIVAHIATAHLDATLACVVEPRYQGRERTLAATGGTHDAHCGTAVNVEGDVADGALGGVFVVHEAHVLKVDVAVLDHRGGLRRRGDVGALVNDLGDASCAGRAHGELDKNHGEHHERHHDGHHISEERRELARGHGASHHKVGANPRDGNDAPVHHEHHERVVERLQALGAHKELVEALDGAPEFLVFVLLAHKCLDHANGRHVLLHHAVHLVIALKDLTE